MFMRWAAHGITEDQDLGHEWPSVGMDAYALPRIPCGMFDHGDRREPGAASHSYAVRLSPVR